MVYIVDPINNTLIDDEKPFKKKEVPVRKPSAVPPKTPTIQKFKNGGAPVVPRSENLDERMQRMIYEYDGGPKPKHYDNPNIVDQENLKQPPKKFSSMDPSTYPSNRSQKQKMTNWDFIMQSARGNPKEMKEVREILNKSYKSNPDLLSDQELKMIGKYKSKAPKVELPKIDPVPIKFRSPIPPTDPETERLKQNYLRAVEDTRKEKIKNATTGLAYLLGGVPIK
jgi:hypothetical protein|tara:strand:- start:3776 stop:4450 length:675 start_codon:yes stop_codon:yes gene_type:complete